MLSIVKYPLRKRMYLSKCVLRYIPSGSEANPANNVLTSLFGDVACYQLPAIPAILSSAVGYSCHIVTSCRLFLPYCHQLPTIPAILSPAADYSCHILISCRLFLPYCHQLPAIPAILSSATGYSCHILISCRLFPVEP